MEGLPEAIRTHCHGEADKEDTLTFTPLEELRDE
jgi:hypothetical protein